MPRAMVSIPAIALLLTGCGATSSPGATPTPTPSPSASATASATATAHGWTTSVSLGANVTVRVNVPGPLTVETGCVPALTAWLQTEAGTVIAPSPSPGLHCQAIALEVIPAGQARDYTTTMPLPPPGTYTVHGLVRVNLPPGAGARVRENIPVVTVTVS